MCDDAKPGDAPEAAAPETGVGERTEVETSRYCLACKKATPFTFTYAEGYLIKAECKECGRVERDRKLLAKLFVEDLIERAFDAAKRQAKKAIHNPVDAVGELPKKVIQKSVREIHRILNIFKE